MNNKADVLFVDSHSEFAGCNNYLKLFLHPLPLHYNSILIQHICVIKMTIYSAIVKYWAKFFASLFVKAVDYSWSLIVSFNKTQNYKKSWIFVVLSLYYIYLNIGSVERTLKNYKILFNTQKIGNLSSSFYRWCCS